MKNKIDIQSLEDTRNVTINKVGVKNVKYPIVVEDRKNGIQNTIAVLDIFVELPHNHRGTHMSRFIEVLNRFHQETFISKLPEFLKEIRIALNADASYAMIKFPYFIRKTAPVSKIESLLSYDCFFKASLREEFELVIGVQVPVTTLCPCSKEISDYGAHSQRSIVTVEVSFKEFVWLEELIEIVENSASSEIYSLLKRVDEKFVTEKAYDNPAFVEDVVREVTLKLQNDNRIISFQVESENFESIHNHNAYACVKREK
ncbi:MAG: GTP cyclohydrolase I FolE2 [Candidatus Cloacimonas sp. 4484_275]|nr:MAG: GTP cyclohydrolase I FolE2 [Candidatus Cloacimonas sp. 4484_275]RLC52990.1 MAG: GTP cyclohydrolase I FolE2 [Candidatus Cloacimonadota bacterium]